MQQAARLITRLH